MGRGQNTCYVCKKNPVWGLPVRATSRKQPLMSSTLDFTTTETSRTSYICVQLKSTPATSTSCLLPLSQAIGQEWGRCHFFAALMCLCFLPSRRETETEQNCEKLFCRTRHMYSSSVLTRALEAVLVAHLQE